MSCTPNYINRSLESVSDLDKKQELIQSFTNKHIELGRSALHETELFKANNAKDPITKEIIGNRIYAGMEGTKRLADSLEWVKNKNTDLGSEVFSIVIDPLYPNSSSRYLKLNLLPLIKEELNKIDEEVPIVSLDDENEFLVYALSKSALLEAIDYGSQFEATIEKIEEEADFSFKKTVLDFVDDLKDNVLRQIGDADFYKGYSNEKLKNIINNFDYHKNNIKYIYTTYLTHGLRRVKELSDVIKELQKRTAQLSTLQGDVYQEELASLLKEYKQLTVYMNFFNIMKDFENKLFTSGLKFPYWSIFNRVKLEDRVEESITDYLTKRGLSFDEDKVIDIVAEGFVTTNKKQDFIEYVKNKLIAEFPSVEFPFTSLENTLKEDMEESRLKQKGKPIEDPLDIQIENAVAIVNAAKSELVKLNENLVLKEMLIPATLKAYQPYFKEKTGQELENLPENIEQKTEEQKKHSIPSVNELKSMYNVSENSISDVDKWWGSISTMSDKVLQSIINRFRTKLLELDFIKKSSFIKLSEIYKNLTSDERISVNSELTREVVVLKDKLKEITGNETPEEKEKYIEVEIDVAGVKYKYQGEKQAFMVSDYAFIEYQNHKTVFYDQLAKGTIQKPFLEAINNRDYEALKDVLAIPQYKNIYSQFFNKNGQYIPGNEKNLNALLKRSFYAYNFQRKTQEEIEQIQEDLGWLDIIYDDVSTKSQKQKLIEKKIAPNVRGKELEYTEDGIPNLSYYKDLAVKVGDKVLVKKVDGELSLVGEEELDDVVEFYFYTGVFSELSPKWKTFSSENNSKFNALSGNKLKYYNALREYFHEANKDYNGEGVKHLRLPSVFKKDVDKGVIEKLKQYKETPSDLWDDVKDAWVYNESDYQGKEGLIQPKFVRRVALEVIERDLFTNIMTYSNAALDYKYKSALDGEAFLITQKFAGDSNIGIAQRNEYYKKAGDGKRLRVSENTLKVWENFLNTNIYGIQKEAKVSIFGIQIDLNKVSSRLKGLINFGTLAWNVGTALPNFAIGQLNSFGYSTAQHLFPEKEWISANSEYFGISSGLGLSRSMKDMIAENESGKSKIGQVFNYFGGVSGEVDLAKMSNKKFHQRFKMGEMLYFTTSAPEHAIQSIAMIAFMKSYMLSNGKSLWESVLYEKGQAIQFDATQDEINDFRNKFEKIKMQLNGNYSDLDKTTWQNMWHLSLALVYKKWIYESVRSRYGKEYFDYTLGQDVEGFHWKFLKQMFRDFQELENEAIPKIQKFLMGAEYVAKGIGRTAGATLNTLTFRQLEKNKQFKEFVYGDADVTAYVRASFEISMFLALGVVAAGLHALNDEDDEEERSIVLQNLEYAAGRIQRDLGFLLPYVNVPFMAAGSAGSGFFVMTDNIAKIYKDPFTVGRTFGAYTKTLAQLFENPQEQYTRSGYGYEKGDYKLIDDLEKTAIAPLFQIVKLMNPEDQLSFVNVVYSNSTSDTKEVKK